MQVVFDRYAIAARGSHVDLATGERVRIATRDVPDDDWRRRWRVRVDALLEGCEGIAALLDAGDATPYAVFEVMRDDAHGSDGRAPGAAERTRLWRALDWLEARGLCAGPARLSRRRADGRLCCDVKIAWPIETPAERDAAARQARAWRRLAGPRAMRRPAGGDRKAGVWRDLRALEEFDDRAGLVDLAARPCDALLFARRSGRVALAQNVQPALVSSELMGHRSFVLVGGAAELSAGAWALSLALESGRRHYAVGRGSGAIHVRERAASYGGPAAAPVLVPRADLGNPRARGLLDRAAEHLSRGHVAAAGRAAARALQLARQPRRVRATGAPPRDRATRARADCRGRRAAPARARRPARRTTPRAPARESRRIRARPRSDGVRFRVPGKAPTRRPITLRHPQPARTIGVPSTHSRRGRAGRSARARPAPTGARTATRRRGEPQGRRGPHGRRIPPALADPATLQPCDRRRPAGASRVGPRAGATHAPAAQPHRVRRASRWATRSSRRSRAVRPPAAGSGAPVRRRARAPRASRARATAASSPPRRARGRRTRARRRA